MPAVCLYFHAHQPYRIRNISFFDLGDYPDFFDNKANKYLLRQFVHISLYPLLKLLRHLIFSSGNKFKFSICLSGILIEQIQEFYPVCLKQLIDLINNENIELISEPYYHSLASEYSIDEFKKQIQMHKKLMRNLFGKKAILFKNTKHIYRSTMAPCILEMGFSCVLIDGSTNRNNSHSPNCLNKDESHREINFMPVNPFYTTIFSSIKSLRPGKLNKMAKTLSRQIASRKEDLMIIGFDLANSEGNHFNTNGISHLLRSCLKSENIRFIHPSEVLENFSPAATYSMDKPLTQYGIPENRSVRNENILQESALKYLYSIEKTIKKTKNECLLATWRKLQSADHFLYPTGKNRLSGFSGSIQDTPGGYQTLMNAIANLEIYARKLLSNTEEINLLASK